MRPVVWWLATQTWFTLQLYTPPCLGSSTCVADMPHWRSVLSISGTKVWNSLPFDVTSASSLPVFKNELKTYLFLRCCDILWHSHTWPSCSFSQYRGPCDSFNCLGHSKNWWLIDWLQRLETASVGSELEKLMRASPSSSSLQAAGAVDPTASRFRNIASKFQKLINRDRWLLTIHRDSQDQQWIYLIMIMLLMTMAAAEW